MIRIKIGIKKKIGPYLSSSKLISLLDLELQLDKQLNSYRNLYIDLDQFHRYLLQKYSQLDIQVDMHHKRCKNR